MTKTTLLTVACHDRIDLLDAWIGKVETLSFDKENTTIVFVDTCSKKPDFVSHFQSMSAQNTLPYMRFERMEKAFYTTGAFWHVYKNIPADHYIFLQDSSEIMDLELIPKMNNFLESYEVVLFYVFHYMTYQCMIDYAEDQINVRPDFGIYGPMFCVRRTTLSNIPEKWMEMMPVCKEHECGWERRWSVIFHALKASMTCISGQIESSHVYYPYIRKILQDRQ